MVNVRGISQASFAAIIVAVIVAAACSGGATAPPVFTSFGGTWHFSASVSDSQFTCANCTVFNTTQLPPFTRCTLAGNLAVTQTGPTFTGQFSGTTRVCVGPNGSAASFDGPVTAGEVAGHTIVFRTSVIQCTWSGSDSTAPGTAVNGYAWCYLPRNSSVNFGHFIGGLQITR